MEKIFDDIIDCYNKIPNFSVQHFQKIRVIQDIYKYLSQKMTTLNSEIFILQLIKLIEYTKNFKNNDSIEYDLKINIPKGNPIQYINQFRNTCAIHSVMTLLSIIPEIIKYSKEKLPKLNKLLSEIVNGEMEIYNENEYFKELILVHQKLNNGELGTIDSDVIDVMRIFLNIILLQMPKNILLPFIRTSDKEYFNIFELNYLDFNSNIDIYNISCDNPRYKKYIIEKTMKDIKPKFILFDVCMIELVTEINNNFVEKFNIGDVKYNLIGVIENTGLHYITHIIFENTIYTYNDLSRNIVPEKHNLENIS